jgi:hypothetical protein
MRYPSIIRATALGGFLTGAYLVFTGQLNLLEGIGSGTLGMFGGYIVVVGLFSLAGARMPEEA